MKKTVLLVYIFALPVGLTFTLTSQAASTNGITARVHHNANSATAPAVKYNPDQFDQFKTTNKCPGCDLSNARLDDDSENHSGADLHGANLSNARFYSDGGNLSQANLQDTNLTMVKFEGVNLSQADFTGAKLFQADLRNSNLYGAVISTDQLAQVQTDCGALLPDGSIGKIGCSLTAKD